MLSYVLPFIAYILFFPVMIVTLSRVEIGIVFFAGIVPVIAVMMKIAQFPAGHNVADFLLIAMVIGSIAKGAKEGERIIEPARLNGVVFIVIVWSGINLIRGYGFSDNPEFVEVSRLQAWKNFMILPVLYFISVNNMNDERWVKALIVVFCFTMVATDFNFYSTFRWMKTEHYQHSIRISGAFSFLGPNELGAFYAIYTFFLLGVSYFITDKRFKVFILVVCACNFYPILFSFSRATYASCLVGMCTLGLLKDRRLLILLVILIAGYSFILPRAVVERIDNTFVSETGIDEAREEISNLEVGGVTVDTTGRKGLWNKAKEHFKAHPLVGIGFRNYLILEGAITHSMYMKILAEEGLIGMSIFVLFMTTILVQAYALYKNSASDLGRGIGLGFFCCVVVHLAGSVSGDQSLYYNLMAVFWIFMGVVARFNVRYGEKGRSKGANEEGVV